MIIQISFEFEQLIIFIYVKIINCSNYFNNIINLTNYVCILI